MRPSPEDVARVAVETGFPEETLDKVFRLMSLLDGLRSHPYLRPRLALKGGTALNLFVFDLPRLSVDVDLNYVGSVDSETMLTERPKLEQAIQAVCGREGLAVRRVPSEHAGGKWRLTYTGSTGTGTLGLDVNFIFRAPLWPPVVLDSREVGGFRATKVRVLDRHELAAGKLVALLARAASRDLFDASELLRSGEMDRSKLRLAFVVYGGINRNDWRTVSAESVASDPVEVWGQLVPLLRPDIAPDRKNLNAWTQNLIDQCRSLLSAVLPLAAPEVEFLARLNDYGEVVPELLTDDADLATIIRNQPGLQWKALNVRKHGNL